MVRLIATDLDATIVRPDLTISPRTLAAFAAAAEAGIHLVAASGRQAFSMAAILAGTPLLGPAIASNGSVQADLATTLIHAEHLMDADAQAALAYGLRAQIDGVTFMTVRRGGSDCLAEHAYRDKGSRGKDLAGWRVTRRYTDLAEVVREPALTLIARHPTLDPEVLYQAALTLDVPGCEPTTSGAPFLEVSKAGVTKGATLQEYCAAVGVEAIDVVAFGDNRNDVDMLAWAGHGVAMGNGLSEAHAVADEIAAPVHEDGVAQVIERILAG